MSFAIFLIEYDLGDTRNHHAIFVRSDGQAGYIFHVKGNIHDGMIYEMKKIRPPHTYRTFVGKHQIGWVSSFNMGRLDSICRSNPPPEKQYHGNRRLNPRRPLRRCQEWTAETIGRLEEQGVLIDLGTLAVHSNSGGDPKLLVGKSWRQPARGGSIEKMLSYNSVVNGAFMLTEA
ncbi:hypothetical protein GGR51DRAFT_559025 [Nemania sp. FL0031]|nr:hypothetical protein GGR51DRAFT_559025 [Nemania sp. FL0031]